MQDIQVRAADTDRERVLAQLHQHTAAGRLTLDEFSERAAAVYRARTLAELAALTTDLPPAADAPAAPTHPWLSWATASVAALLLVLVAVAALLPGGAMMGCI
ncbi:DUF1707 domain-containing protein [Mycobacterium sp. OTB74]|jgi:hypothetical protein|uniref:DUF1707 SHOCT-like domain-containing protein n=1 Tax=Mycobacterium sp. OTB74 TaxID=1853452 RepID=UPI0024769FEC|nr:DUF1707 domain-containing protein [Mycobacterium sp. OTB74]